MPGDLREVLCACGAMRMLDVSLSYSRGNDIHAFDQCAIIEVRTVARAPSSPAPETSPDPSHRWRCVSCGAPASSRDGEHRCPAAPAPRPPATTESGRAPAPRPEETRPACEFGAALGRPCAKPATWRSIAETPAYWCDAHKAPTDVPSASSHREDGGGREP